MLQWQRRMQQGAPQDLMSTLLRGLNDEQMG